MTKFITPATSPIKQKRLVVLGFTLLTLTAAMAATFALVTSDRAQKDREAWVQSAFNGYQNVKTLCADRQIFGFQNETPPIVHFYLNEQGAFENSYAAWELRHDGDRLYYVLEVQFSDFDDETLTRIAELDNRIDDGNLLSGELQLSMSGFACVIKGPVSTSEQLVSNLAAKTTVNPI